jgi:molybdopterin-guanine dinucleotide biosynthesis protein A
MLVHQSLALSAADYLLAGRRRLRDWAEAQRPAYGLFHSQADPMAFSNLNTHADLAGETGGVTAAVASPS